MYFGIYGRIPGNNGIWVGMFCVLVEFFPFVQRLFHHKVTAGWKRMHSAGIRPILSGLCFSPFSIFWDRLRTMFGHAEKIWLTLIGFTLLGALLGETGNAGWPLTLTVVGLIFVKGSIVIDHYMEMRSANQRIRNVLRLFITLIPILVILSFGWGEAIRRLTTLN